MPGPKSPAQDTHVLVRMLEARLNAERAERRRLQEELALHDSPKRGGDAKELAERLELVIAERTRALSLARDEAVAASRSKSSFLANMSHEIRTPLTSIIGFAELLQDPNIAEAERADAAKTIIRNGRHLLEVINDILDLSKIESNQLTLEHIDVGLPKLLSDVEALAAGRAQEKLLVFTIAHHLPLPPLLRTDPVRLKQILLNFCSNAVKFSSEGEVRLDVHHDVLHNRIRFEVTDNGIGMSQVEIDRLFRPFVQADVSTTRKFGGTGLGLCISKQLADMLGGEIGVSSQPGVGSRFTVSVPVGLAPSKKEMLDSVRDFVDFQPRGFQVTAIEIPDLSGRVLVAEDGVDNRRLLGTYLRQAGLEFDMVDNGNLAVESALAREYALVLMDIQMPVMDGVSATKLLRASGYQGPIVALTANVMQSDVALYRTSGCNDVLAKPIDKARLFSVLQEYVGGESSNERGAEDGFACEMRALTSEFVAGLPKTLAAIGSAAQSMDRTLLKTLLHALRGTAGSYGFPEITRLAKEAETALDGPSPTVILERCTVLVAHSREAIRHHAAASQDTDR